MLNALRALMALKPSSVLAFVRQNWASIFGGAAAAAAAPSVIEAFKKDADGVNKMLSQSLADPNVPATDVASAEGQIGKDAKDLGFIVPGHNSGATGQSQSGTVTSWMDKIDPEKVGWGAAAAAALALIYYGFKSNVIPKYTGDALASILRVVGQDDLAAKVDTWGEDEDILMAGNPGSQDDNLSKSQINHYENQMVILREIFSGSDELVLHKAKLFKKISNFKGLEKYVETKTHFARATRLAY